MEKIIILMHNRVLRIYCKKLRSLLTLESGAITRGSWFPGGTLCVVEYCHLSG